MVVNGARANLLGCTCRRNMNYSASRNVHPSAAHGMTLFARWCSEELFCAMHHMYVAAPRMPRDSVVSALDPPEVTPTDELIICDNHKLSGGKGGANAG